LEQPVRRLGFRGIATAALDAAPRSRRALGAAFAMVLALGLSAASLAALVTDPGRGEAQVYIEAGQDAIDQAAKPDPVEPGSDQADAPVAEAVTTGDAITAIGDSVLLAAAPALQAAYPGIHIDAAVSRQMSSAPAVL